MLHKDDPIWDQAGQVIGQAMRDTGVYDNHLQEIEQKGYFTMTPEETDRLYARARELAPGIFKKKPLTQEEDKNV